MESACGNPLSATRQDTEGVDLYKAVNVLFFFPTDATQVLHLRLRQSCQLRFMQRQPAGRHPFAANAQTCECSHSKTFARENAQTSRLPGRLLFGLRHFDAAARCQDALEAQSLLWPSGAQPAPR